MEKDNKQKQEEKVENENISMNKIITVVFALVLLVVMAIFVQNYMPIFNGEKTKVSTSTGVSYDKKEEPKQNTEKIVEETNKAQENKTAEVSKESNNSNESIEIDAKTFNEKLAAGETMMVDFYATWCGPCRIMAPRVEEAKKAGVNIYKIDVDKEIKLSTEQGIRALPTIVQYKGGEEKGRTLGVVSVEKLKTDFEVLKNK